MKTAYIKFCGGCNPRYDRGALAKELKQRFSGQVEFSTHDANIPREIGIVIQGCEKDCVQLKNLAKADRQIVIRYESDFTDAVKAIEEELCKN